jgi:hypothetical protein
VFRHLVGLLKMKEMLLKVRAEKKQVIQVEILLIAQKILKRTL